MIKKDIHSWEENVYTDNNTVDVTMELRTRLHELLTEIYEYQLNEENEEMTVTLAGYVTKTLSLRSTCIQCKEKLVFDDDDNKHDHGKYLTLKLPMTRLVGHDTDLPSSSNISKTVRVNITFRFLVF